MKPLPFVTPRLPQFVLLLTLAAGTVAHSLHAQTDPVRLTENTGQDIFPAWDPRGGTIAYLRSAAASGSGVPFNLYQVAPDTPGESVMATGPTLGFGLANSPTWVGSSGRLMLEERAVFHEYLSFDSSQSPFTRIVHDGSDAAFTKELGVPGGGGGGYVKASRDGTTALWRSSTSGGSGTQEIRVGAISNLTGQAANAVGTVIVSSFHSSEQRYLLGAALSPDGSKAVLALPASGPSSGSSITDLWLYNSDGSGTPVNLTKTAATGVYNRGPDFTPDGSKIIFARFSGVQGETWDLYQIDIDGNNLVQITDTPKFGEYEPSVSPDGERVAFRGTHISGFEDTPPALPEGESANSNIYVMSIPQFKVTIDRPTQNLNAIDIIWVTAVDTDYQVLVSTNLMDWEPDWDVVSGDGLETTESRPIGTDGARFYQLQQLP